MKQRIRYWSCSRFADWLRGTAKPRSETAGGWHDWKEDAKARNPLRFWLAEEFLDNVQDFVNWPMDRLHALTYWINNRFVEQTHVCRTGLKKGDWHETGDRMLYGLFNELAWFVSEQKSWMEFISHRDKYRHLPFWKTTWPFRHFTNFNYPELGLAYLEWEKGLVFNESWYGNPGRQFSEEEKANYPDYGQITPQAKTATEIGELYDWWVNVRPKRPDPMDVGGWSAYCDQMSARYGDAVLHEERTDDERAMSKQALDKTHAIEQAYEYEDTVMMKRLIEIRGSLWT
jgi:hypothetical protein